VTVFMMRFSLDQRSKETTFVHQIFGGYLRSQGRLWDSSHIPLQSLNFLFHFAYFAILYFIGTRCIVTRWPNSCYFVS